MLKVGQNVQANGKVGVKHAPWCPCIPELKSFAGMIGQVKEHSLRSSQVQVEFPNGQTFWFHEDELEVVPEEVLKKGQKVKVVDTSKSVHREWGTPNISREPVVGEVGTITAMDGSEQPYKVTLEADGKPWWFYPQEIKAI
jgi:hypothetical protein